ncbi:reverse transcriptase [Brachionus plicatilis]|uniref:Reverse transcriptase n=1 Tax=Brachionus plicatilis TaxID=10195 RepID=A0A3M7QC52_BRAPC|nr:reverse transcriptase [Brachionus plicatilis]
MPIQCFNCQALGQKSESWKKEKICMRCAKRNDHTYKTCPVSDPKYFKCINCLGNHAACSKSCPKIIEAISKLSEKQAVKSNNKYPLFKRIDSTFNKSAKHIQFNSTPTLKLLAPLYTKTHNPFFN